MLKINRFVGLLMVICFFASLLTACSDDTPDATTTGQADSSPGFEEMHSGERESQSGLLDAVSDIMVAGNGENDNKSGGVSDEDAWRIRVVDTSGGEIWSFTEEELIETGQDQINAFTHVYSTINNWPSTRFLVAGGYSVKSILEMAGALETVQTISFRAADGYEASLTREQLFGEQYYYPKAGESEDGAEPVMPIIAYRWREGTTNLSELRDEKPTLIFGQRYMSEHTNPAFVEEVAEIVIDTAPCEIWAAASTFPLPGSIAEGETVKLQHQFYGIVKMFYTLDGSDPTTASKMYNPSTYQPELNVPIPITEHTIIKVLVTGYGKKDSEISTFEFDPTG